MRLISVTEDFGDSPTGRHAENIKASGADWYSHNLSVETKKGQRQKAEMGWYPSVAPVGYLNRDKIIEQDVTRVPLIREAFTLYGSGSYTLKQPS